MGQSEEQADSKMYIPEVFEPYCGLYPGIVSFTADYDAADYREWVSRSNGDPVPAPLMMVLEDGVRAESVPAPGGVTHQLAWHSALAREIQLQGALFDGDRPLEGIVCAPGISSGWSNDALYELSRSIQDSFSVAPTAFARWCACFGQEYPSTARLKLLRVLGFSKARLSVDVTSPKLSADALRVEFGSVEELLREARNLGYRSLAVDLVLPAVVMPALVDGIEALLAATQVECLRLIIAGKQTDTVSNNPLSALRATVLPELGYRHLGLDWYVTESEPSLGSGAALYWSPLGFTDIKGLDIIGVGPGAVSVLEDACSQNTMRLEPYQRAVVQGEIPIERGVELESDDLLRRTVISALLVDEYFDVGALEERWGILFPRYFETEMPELRELEQRGKLQFTGHKIHALERDRNSLNVLCKIFDNQDRVARVLPLRKAY